MRITELWVADDWFDLWSIDNWFVLPKTGWNVQQMTDIGLMDEEDLFE